jgi:predicted component of viral defense system (DUF524 family)
MSYHVEITGQDAPVDPNTFTLYHSKSEARSDGEHIRLTYGLDYEIRETDDTAGRRFFELHFIT